jgi:hypothetical protein
VQPVISVNGNILTSTSAVSYQWYKNGNIIPGATNQSFTYIFYGSYTVKTTDVHGCISISEPVLFTSTTNEDNASSLISIFPNPNAGTILLTIDHLNGAEIKIEITDALGRQVYFLHEEDIVENNYRREIILPGAVAGMYCLQVSIDSSWYFRKIIVE